jgi:hypothetical protein
MILIVLAIIFVIYYGIILVLAEISKRIQENKKAENSRKRFNRLMNQQ